MFLAFVPGLHTFITHSPKFKFCTAYYKHACKSLGTRFKISISEHVCGVCVGRRGGIYIYVHEQSKNHISLIKQA